MPRIFQKKKELGADNGANSSGGDYPPAMEVFDAIAVLAAEFEIEAETEGVSKSFEEKVRMNGKRAEMKVDGKRHGR